MLSLISGLKVPEALQFLTRRSVQLTTPSSGNARVSLRVSRIPVGKAFDLNRVAAGVAKEHRPLLAGLTLKAYLWLQDKLRIGGFEAFGQGQPVGLEQDDAEVGHGHHVLADLPVRDYITRMGERASVQKVNADRKANAVLLMERVKAAAK